MNKKQYPLWLAVIAVAFFAGQAGAGPRGGFRMGAVHSGFGAGMRFSHGPAFAPATFRGSTPSALHAPGTFRNSTPSMRFDNVLHNSVPNTPMRMQPGMFGHSLSGVSGNMNHGSRDRNGLPFVHTAVPLTPARVQPALAGSGNTTRVNPVRSVLPARPVRTANVTVFPATSVTGSLRTLPVAQSTPRLTPVIAASLFGSLPHHHHFFPWGYLGSYYGLMGNPYGYFPGYSAYDPSSYMSGPFVNPYGSINPYVNPYDYNPYLNANAYGDPDVDGSSYP